MCVAHETETCLQKEKKWKWIFGRQKNKRLPSIRAPPPSKETKLSEAEEDHNKQALAVAIASAAAAEAAITAAQVAVEVIRLHSAHQCKEKQEESQPVKSRHGAPQSTHQCQREIEEYSAIKIQTAFRGYLVSFSRLSSLVYISLYPLLHLLHPFC